MASKHPPGSLRSLLMLQELHDNSVFRFAPAFFTITFPVLAPRTPLESQHAAWNGYSTSYSFHFVCRCEILLRNLLHSLFVSSFHSLLCCNAGNWQAKLRNSASPFSMHQARDWVPWNAFCLQIFSKCVVHLGEDTFGVASSATCATGCQNQISVARQLLGKESRQANLPVKQNLGGLLLSSSFHIFPAACSAVATPTPYNTLSGWSFPCPRIWGLVESCGVLLGQKCVSLVAARHDCWRDLKKIAMKCMHSGKHDGGVCVHKHDCSHVLCINIAYTYR